MRNEELRSQQMLVLCIGFALGFFVFAMLVKFGWF